MIAAPEPTLADKVAFLSRPEAYPHPVRDLIRKETHMSWVFLAGDRAYKLKKPVRFPYLDFSTLERRETACREEFSLNRRLAPDVYLGVAPVVASPHGLSLAGEGTVVDWVVVMRRLDEQWSLEQVVRDGRLQPVHLDLLITTLVRFYRRARPVPLSPGTYLAGWPRNLSVNGRVLLDPRFDLPSGLVRRIDRAQRRFVRERSGILLRRARRHRIVDGHGDLRPEHIWLDHEIRIIDCLEFNARLRSVDPLDEVAFLTVECERLGAPSEGARIGKGVARGLHKGAPPELFLFYRCYRAMLRARLAIAHLCEEHPRTPEKWPRLARAYLDIAARDAARLERSLRPQKTRRSVSAR
jgi:aminoglycoside phosphotransferase family enzyme